MATKKTKKKTAMIKREPVPPLDKGTTKLLRKAIHDFDLEHPALIRIDKSPLDGWWSFRVGATRIDAHALEGFKLHIIDELDAKSKRLVKKIKNGL